MSMTTELVQSESVLGELIKAETDVQIATAKAWPRDLKTFVSRATDMVTMSEDIAGECLYSLKRSGKTIEGPSVRFAEFITSAWGNCRCGARVVGEDERFVTAQGVFSDLEANVIVTMEIRRRITDSKGNRYNDDMIGVTANAACAIAVRNVTLKGIPKGFWAPIFDKARQTAIGDAKLLSTKRQQLVSYFSKMGVDASMIETYLQVPSVEMITLDNIATLRGLATRIKDGDVTIDEAFRIERTVSGPNEYDDQLIAELDGADDLTEVNAIRDLTLEQHDDDDQRKIINALCDVRVKQIKATRGERSNEIKEQETT